MLPNVIGKISVLWKRIDKIDIITRIFFDKLDEFFSCYFCFLIKLFRKNAHIISLLIFFFLKKIEENRIFTKLWCWIMTPIIRNKIWIQLFQVFICNIILKNFNR